HLLLDDLHREERSEILGPDGLEGAGVDHRRQRRRQIGLDVFPAARQVLLVEDELRLGHGNLLQPCRDRPGRDGAWIAARASASAYAWRPASSAKSPSGMRWST